MRWGCSLCTRREVAQDEVLGRVVVASLLETVAGPDNTSRRGGVALWAERQQKLGPPTQ